jgi:hypothetical protein
MPTKHVSFNQLSKLVVNELHTITSGMELYHAGLKKWVKVKPSLGMFLGDMPQRNEACCMVSKVSEIQTQSLQKNQQSFRPCHLCFVHKSELHLPYDENTMGKRDHQISMMFYEEMCKNK